MKITISLAQMAVRVSKPEENLKKAEAWIAEAKRRGSDIICFPEMWTTGFDWAYNAEASRGHEKIIDQVAGMARRYGIWINGSMLALDKDGKASNASILFDPKGFKAAIYRKTHLFSLVHENEHLVAGKALCAVDTPWGLTGLAVCYEIRFPEIFRTYALKGAKIVFLPAAFPYPKIMHWKTLVRARAIEDQMYMVGTNQAGTEDLGKDGRLTYFGNSMIIDPWGETVVEAGDKEELVSATIDIDLVDKVREKMKVFRDRRPELYDLGT